MIVNKNSADKSKKLLQLVVGSGVISLDKANSYLIKKIN